MLGLRELAGAFVFGGITSEAVRRIDTCQLVCRRAELRPIVPHLHSLPPCPSSKKSPRGVQKIGELEATAMTTLVPLNEGRQPQSVPAFVSHAKQPATELERVVKAILRARRIAVVCGMYIAFATLCLISGIAHSWL